MVRTSSSSLAKESEDGLDRKASQCGQKDLLGRRTQKRPFDTGWLGVSQCQACQMEESTEKHRLYHCSEWHEIMREILEACRKWEQKARTSKKEWKWQRGIVAHPAPCLERLESGEHVVGRWYSWTMMKRWGPCVGCTAQWRRNLRSSVPPRGRSSRPSHAFSKE